MLPFIFLLFPPGGMYHVGPFCGRGGVVERLNLTSSHPQENKKVQPTALACMHLNVSCVAVWMEVGSQEKKKDEKRRRGDTTKKHKPALENDREVTDGFLPSTYTRHGVDYCSGSYIVPVE